MGASEKPSFSIVKRVPIDYDGSSDGNPEYPKCGPFQVDQTIMGHSL